MNVLHTIRKILPLVLTSGLAMADGFDGLDLGVAFGIQNVNYGGGYQLNSYGPAEFFHSVNDTDGTLNLDIGYNFRTGDKFYTGIVANLQPIDSTIVYAQKIPGTLTKNLMTSRYDLSLLQGYLLNPESLIYGKIGYSHASRKLSDPYQAWQAQLGYNGYVLGLGIKTESLGRFIGYNRFYGFVEYNFSQYGNQHYKATNPYRLTVVSSDLGLYANTGLIGIGYVF